MHNGPRVVHRYLERKGGQTMSGEETGSASQETPRPTPPPVPQTPPAAYTAPPPPPPPKSGGIPGWAIALIVVGAVLVLLVVVAIPAALLLPALAKAQEAARRASCMNNARQIGLAMLQYTYDHDDEFVPLVDATGAEVYTAGEIPRHPSRTGFAVLLHKGYLTTTKVFVCPSSRDTVDTSLPSDYRDATLEQLILAEGNCSYGWDPTKKHSAEGSCALVADKPSLDVSRQNEGTWENNSDNHDKEGQNVFYNDGHIKWGVTSQPDSGDDPDIYTGGRGYEQSHTDAKIIR